jgi:hypothetical protein
MRYVDRKPAWESTMLAYRPLVQALPYAYGPSVTVTRVRAHHLVVDELVRLLTDAAAIAAGLPGGLLRIAYGGCYVWRPIRGGTKLSTHTWGIAVDLDPANNPLGTPHDPVHGIPLEVVALFEDAGWTWGGRWTRCDPQHFQRAAAY